MLPIAAFCAGVIILYCTGIRLASPVFLLPLFALLLVFPRRRRVLCLALCLLGFLYAGLSVLSQQSRILSPQWEGQKISVRGYRCSLLDRGIHFIRFDFCLIGVPDGAGHDVGEGVLRLYLSTGKAPEAARIHQLEVTLKRPHGAANPDGAPYERYLFARGVIATGQVLRTEELGAQERDASFSWRHVMAMQAVALRQHLSDRLDQDLHALDQRGVMRALLIGDRSQLTPEVNQVMNRTGVQHLLAISGLHVGIVVGWLWFVLSRFHYGVIAVIAAGLLYVVLTGFAESAQRAWVMVVMGLWVLSGRVAWSLLRIWWLALFLVLLWQPLATLLMGFWFSFVAVLVLLLLQRVRPIEAAPLRWLLWAQFALTLVMMPLYQQFSIHQGAIGLLANMLAIPLLSLLVLPAILIAFLVAQISPTLGVYCYVFANEATAFLLEFLRALAPVVTPVWPDRPVWLWGMTLLVGVSLVLPLGRSARWLFMPILLVFALYPSQRQGVSASEERFVVMDAGQGLAIVMQMQDGVWIYDTGPSFEGVGTASQVLVPYLQRRSVHRDLAGLIVSHADLDHAGGYLDLIEAFEVRQLWVGDVGRMQSLYPLRHAQVCSAGMSYRRDAYTLDVLYPLADSRPDSSNNHSCVVRLTWRGKRFLLMGDLEGKAEMELVRQYGAELKADVLIGGHHGSNNATRFALLKFVEPDYVVFSAGYRNRFGHPHPDVMQRVEASGAVALQTAHAGAISFAVGETSGDLSFETVRRAGAPFWVSLFDSPQH